ncbi:MAG: hypothetical protein LKI34_02835 [Bifidobacterium tibiigranuli]|jgi:hypothetical protein|uniref:hypothetical protein n=1 Tax=Bifidobacterium tibiigranuli TaxID=2172043 RepID=UPI0026EB37A2|nr:hypothetical protein [Bifidobacterium tibiigranuli]MCI1673142.1 hypothetical protein [Bifidobacterium tibiigranuli]MCI1713613.1 hypothetical protein [Bifidobacterium tibiigranuli]
MQLSIMQDIEEQCIQQLNDVLTRIPETQGIPIGTRIPINDSGSTPSEFIRLIASNPTAETMTTTTWTITLEGWAATETRASRITALATAALGESTGILFGVQTLGGPGNDPHPDYPAMSRYAATLQARSRNIIQQIQ